jgi:hypothetical protein
MGDIPLVFKSGHKLPTGSRRLSYANTITRGEAGPHEETIHQAQELLEHRWKVGQVSFSVREKG